MPRTLRGPAAIAEEALAGEQKKQYRSEYMTFIARILLLRLLFSAHETYSRPH
jgi:hypothetical protein